MNARERAINILMNKPEHGGYMSRARTANMMRLAYDAAIEDAANEARCGNNGHDPSERIAAAIWRLSE